MDTYTLRRTPTWLAVFPVCHLASMPQWRQRRHCRWHLATASEQCSSNRKQVRGAAKREVGGKRGKGLPTAASRVLSHHCAFWAARIVGHFFVQCAVLCSQRCIVAARRSRCRLVAVTLPLGASIPLLPLAVWCLPACLTATCLVMSLPFYFIYLPSALSRWRIAKRVHKKKSAFKIKIK